MADLNIDSTTIAIRTSTGTDPFAFASSFGTPDCAILVGGQCAVLGTSENPGQFSFGFADGTNQFVASMCERDGRTSVVSRKRYSASHCGLVVNPASGAVRASAAFSSFTADTFTINWDDASPSASQWTAYGFVLPTGAVVKVGNFSASTSLDGTVDVTTLAAEADVVILTTSWTTTVDTSSTTALHGMGFYTKSGGQRGISYMLNHGDPVGDPRVMHHATHALHNADADVGVELSGHASGFTATTRDTGGGPAYQIGYLAISFAASTHEADVGAFDVPTATGTDATTGVGFKPEFLFGLLSTVDTVGTTQVDASAEAYGFGFAHGTAAADQSSHSIHSEDGSASTNANNIADDAFCQVMDGSTPSLQTADLDSFDTDGFTLDWTAAPLSTAGFGAYLALRAIVGAQTVTPATVTVELEGQVPAVALGGVTRTPATVVAELQLQAPTVTLGGLTLSPATVEVELQAQAATVLLGGITAQPATVTVELQPQAPTIERVLTAAQATVIVELQVQAPATAVGPVTIQPATVTVQLEPQAPTIALEGVLAAPATLEVELQLQAPAVAVGGISATPATLTAELALQAPSVARGGLVATPDTLVVELELQPPAGLLKALTVEPAGVTVELQLQAPTLAGGGRTLILPALTVELEFQGPSVALGGLTAAPPVLDVTLEPQAPTILLGGLTVQPATAIVELQLQAPSVVGGGTIATPATVEVELQVQVPTIALGGIAAAQGQPVTVELQVQAPTVDVSSGAQTVQPAGVIVELEPQAPSVALGGVARQPATQVVQLALGAPTVSRANQVAPGTVTVELQVQAPAAIVTGSLAVPQTAVTVQLALGAPTLITQALSSRIYSGELYIEIVRDRDAFIETVRDRDRYIEVVRDRNLVIL